LLQGSTGLAEVTEARGGNPQGVGSDCTTVLCEPDLPGWTPDGATRAGDPPTVTKGTRPGDLDLEWSLGCSPHATDYTVQEGRVGSWHSHQAVLCDTVGVLTAATVSPALGALLPRRARHRHERGQLRPGLVRRGAPTVHARLVPTRASARLSVIE
jgi:hypothetical protein